MQFRFTALTALAIVAGTFAHGIAHGPAAALPGNETAHLTPAVYFHGEIMPYVELPVVEVTAGRNAGVLYLKAVVIDGQVMPAIDLEEVVITPSV